MGLAAISYDSVAVLKNFADRKSIQFPLLSDEGSKAIRAWGILNEHVPRTAPFFGVPDPATYVIAPDGTIRAIYREEDYTRRYTVGTILSRPEESTVSESGAPHGITVHTSSTDAVVRGGERIRLFVTLSLPPKLHVYAPGVEGYIPLSWSVTPGGFEVLTPTFPASRKLRLEAIGETVPVYERQVTLSRDLIIAQPRDLSKSLTPQRTLRIEGTLRYQACDDRQCFLPTDVPLGWTLQYEAPDSTRVPVELRRQ